MPITSAVDWLKQRTDPKRPWLIVGKGPSFDRISKVLLASYTLIGINHVCTKVGVAVNLFTDVEAAVDCKAALGGNPVPVIMPWHPHVQMKPSPEDLLVLCGKNQVLMGVYRRNLLFSFNSSTAHKLRSNPALPLVRARYFSGVAVVSLLLSAGVKRFFSIGLDGGTKYGKAFDPKDRLANKRKSFDIQFAEIRRLLKLYNARHVPLLRG